MTKGFVFGKYLPFHKGHEELIRFALERCDSLIVIVCCSDKENIGKATRTGWVRDTFLDSTKIQIIGLDYEENKLPNSSVSSRKVSKIWAEKFLELLPDVNVVFTSEKYGDYLAEYMNINHILFDENRSLIPISATIIRENILMNWHFLPNSVKAFYQKKIILLGTESTGKSSLAKALAEHFNSSLVKEVGREIVEDSSEFSMDQLIRIAQGHANQIKKTCQELSPFVFIDTDIHITQSYALFGFGEYLSIDESIYRTNAGDHYFYLCNDFPFIQDGTRMQESERNRLDDFHRKTLKHFEVEFFEVKGSWDQRLETMVEHCIASFKRIDLA